MAQSPHDWYICTIATGPVLALGFGMTTSGDPVDQKELLALKLQEALRLADDNDLTQVAALIAEAVDAMPGPKHLI